MLKQDGRAENVNKTKSQYDKLQVKGVKVMKQAKSQKRKWKEKLNK